MKIIDTVKV